MKVVAKAPRTDKAIWMIRNQVTNLEPGSITIQTRGVGSNTNVKGGVNGQSVVGAPLASLPMPPPQLPVLSQPPIQVQQPGQAQQPRKSREAGASERDIHSSTMIH